MPTRMSSEPGPLATTSIQSLATHIPRARRQAHKALEEHFASGRDGDIRMKEFAEVNTSLADYVWLPLTFDGERPVIT